MDYQKLSTTEAKSISVNFQMHFGLMQTQIERPENSCRRTHLKMSWAVWQPGLLKDPSRSNALPSYLVQCLDIFSILIC